MSHAKSSSRLYHSSDFPETFKWRPQAHQLQELFPAWSGEDIQSLITEVGGDVELAVTRITEGSAEQWGSVIRKKDKKTATSASHPAKESAPSRGDSRGGRGGRGRGGPGRGGSAGRGRGGPPRGGSVNGHISRTGTPRPTAASTVEPAPVGEQTTKATVPDVSSVSSTGDKGKDSSWAEQTNGWRSTQLESTPAPAWGSSSWGADVAANGSMSSHSPAKQPTKTPATSKLSWAQVARSQEKPTPLHSSGTPASAPPAPPSPLAPSLVSEQPSQLGWEEPTTIQEPIWEDDASNPPISNLESWPAHPEVPSEEKEESPQAPSSPIEIEKLTEVNATTSSHREEDLTAEKELEPHPAVSIPPTSSSAPAVAATPSPKLAGRPAAVSHRASARHKISDQPVVMPNSFGANIEKIGMQFGSLSLGGDSLDNNPTEAEAPAATSAILDPIPTSAPPAPTSKQEEAISQPPPAAPPTSSASLNSVFQLPQTVSQQSQQPQVSTVQTSTSHHIPTSVSQPAQVQTPAHSVSTISQQQQTTTAHHPPHSASHSQQQQHPSAIPQQAQQGHNLHHYTQHSLSTHHDPQALSSLHQQPQSAATHSNYFRQSDASAASPYFQTPTPPSAQAQENYASFGQLASQAQHQQGPHLGSFAPADYGYGDTQRSFYDTYNQQTGFGNRTMLGHDDLKSLPSAQQQPPSSGLPPSGNQASQQHATQGNQQAGGGQVPQQGYPPPPVPYYYTHPYPQNQFYGSPYSSGYGVPQPFVKYPTIFQPGPAGPGSAPSPAGKQPGGNVGVGVQPQNNPYTQGLYQPGGYDDYQHHTPHQQQQHHQHSHSLGLGQGVGVSGDYGKLYSASQGMQGFMGLGQAGAGAGVPTSGAGGPRGGNSPETAYKPYAPKDVGVGVGGRGVQQGQGQIQGQPQGQGQGQGSQNPQGQGFYSANRFGTSVGAGVGGGGAGVGGGPQNALHQQGPQAHLGYPQGAGDAGFYSYPGRQQYWQ